MRINEVEELVGIPKANIRFYEKQGLISPGRRANNYREYTEEDVLELQNIVILRKLGVSVEDIERLQKGELSLQDAITANIASLESQIGQLEGALRLSRQIVNEGSNELDTPRYWNIIREQETAGASFVDVASDFWVSLMVPTIRMRFHIPNGTNLRDAILWLLLGNTLFALSKTFLWKDGGFLGNFFYWPGIMLAVSAIIFPIFWLSKKRPKAANFLWNTLFAVCIGVLAFFALLLIGGFLRWVWNDLFG